ncbi:hypothetical protein THAOC_17626 [Thalassiosira oceanica]|uniref:Uncharacterized protein n=1 Tax=Thalassiosira oceanica TaxID=159749 RepID=K0S943_THAOC|nr:hypothetical protein THAOC_17626 [Thalassiosira oceanica]|eukprot:EJK61815.1 hypothetical protein THAOC_17626 [Thalassiosira oceanica]
MAHTLTCPLNRQPTSEKEIEENHFVGLLVWITGKKSKIPISRKGKKSVDLVSNCRLPKILTPLDTAQ